MDNLIQDALLYHDNNITKYNDLFQGITADDIVYKDDKIIFKNKKQNKTITANFHYLGLFVNPPDSKSVWIWNWSLPYQQTQIELCKKILLYMLDYPINNVFDSIIKSLLLTSRFEIIPNSFEFDIMMALSMFITKSSYIVSIDLKHSNQSSFHDQYILLTDIVSL